MKQHNLMVENIKCGGCANSIRMKLSKIVGIEAVKVDIEKGKVTFKALNQESILNIENILHKMGYPKVGNNHLGAKAKSFVSCMIGRVSES